MLKKMQRRFILAAMAAFAAVMAVLLAGVNLVNYVRTTTAQDRMIEMLMGRERQAAVRPGAAPPPLGDMPGGGPEAEFTTRFFAVYCDLEGGIRYVSRDHIVSVDENTVGDYVTAALEGGRKRGYCGEYRYGIGRERDGYLILFLNVSPQLQFIRSLLLVSSAVGAASLLVVFGLVLFFSGYAVRPYVKNIERQKRFITDAGHELKTPIASISASADIAAMEYEGDEWIANIQRQTVRLSRLVGDLVALSRLDEEMPFPEQEDFSLSDAAWEAAEPFGVLAQAEGKEYHQKIEENMTIHGDRNAIRQLISLLLDNAVKYAGPAGEISLDIYGKRGKACIEVFNTCVLPDITDLDKLFDRFYRVDESRSAGGTGIGLSMAQAIAEAHGGRISVKGIEGKGICFRVIL